MPSRKSSSTDLAVVGKWVFLIGLVIALLGGLVIARPASDPKLQDYLVYLLMVLGLVGGYLHIQKEDEHHFILLAIGLALFSQPFGNIPTVGSYIASAIYFVTVFLGMAIVAIAVRNIIAWFTE